MTEKENEMSCDEVEIHRMLDQNLVKIRELNDDLRIRRLGGSIMVTAGIAGLGGSAVTRVIAAITAFDAFTPENDPNGEHDCAVMTVDCIKVIWKIDYYDLKRQFYSPNASDRNVTSRVMTVMRADEY